MMKELQERHFTKHFFSISSHSYFNLRCRIKTSFTVEYEWFRRKFVSTVERFFYAVFGFWHETRATSVRGVRHHLSKVLIRAPPLCSARCMLEEIWSTLNIIPDLKPFFRNIIISNYNSSVSTSTFQSVACLTPNWISLSLFGVVALATPNDANKNSMFSWAKVSFSPETCREGAYWFWLMKALVLETSLATRARRIFFEDNSMMLLLAVEARWTISISPALPRRITDLKLNYQNCSFVFQ